MVDVQSCSVVVTRRSSRMHANSHDPRSSPAYVGPQFAPAIAVDEETVAIVGASTRGGVPRDPRGDDDGRRRARDDERDGSPAPAAPTTAPGNRSDHERHEQQPFGARQRGQSRERAGRAPQPRIACPSRVQRQQHRPERKRDEDRLGHHRTVRRDQDRADRGERGRHESDPRPGDPASDQPGQCDRHAAGRDTRELRRANRVARDRLHQGEERRIERWPRGGSGPLGREDGRIGERVLVPDDAALQVVPARVDSEAQSVQHDDVVQQPQDRSGQDDAHESRAEATHTRRRTGHDCGSYGGRR